MVGFELKGHPGDFSLEDSLAELAQLASTAGLLVVGEITQRISTPNPATLIGSGKLQEIIALRAELGASVILFDAELSPRQQREIEKAVKDDEIKVIDRTALDSGYLRQACTDKRGSAAGRTGAVRVPPAAADSAPGRIWPAKRAVARRRVAPAGGSARPGETQLEVDRREIGRRIAHLRRELEEVRAHRQRYRERRKGASLSTVSLVGYTNAGKSTLLNAMTRLAGPEGSGAGVLSADMLFATLDPTTRRVRLPGGRRYW